MAKTAKSDCKCVKVSFDYKALCRNDVVEPKTINILWKGSRSGQLHAFEVDGSMKIGDFKTMVFNEFHGFELDSENYKSENDFTTKHNIMVTNSNRLLDRDYRTFADYNMINDEGVPYEVSFCLGLSGGMPPPRRKQRVEDVSHQRLDTDIDTVKAVFNLNLPP